MLIYVGEPHYKIITAVEGTGDNLTAQDIRDGFVDYFMSTIYEQDGDELVEKDGGQILSSKSIADMETEEKLERVFDYWELGDLKSRDADYTILDY